MKMFMVLDDRVWADSKSTVAATETIRFALNGAEYEIDLAAENAEKLTSAISEWLPYARKVERRKVPPEASGPRAIESPDGQYPVHYGVILRHAEKAHMSRYWAGFRAWADEHGIDYTRQYPSGPSKEYRRADVQRYEEYLDAQDTAAVSPRARAS